tara:strand:- start:4870 stop:6087 length:1218 start_codon:yes stop_codon:yes gene_type:complete
MKIEKYSTIESIIINSKNILIIQDIDGVCIPLVKDPLTRKLDKNYIYAAKLLGNEFYVLTCGEHEGIRGVNRIIERSLKSKVEPIERGLYLRGLAACGVEYQGCQGETSFEGISQNELNFLAKVPNLMRQEFRIIVKALFPSISDDNINYHSIKSICDTKFSPTINFNSLFELVKDDWQKKKLIQNKFEKMMNEIINKAELEGLKESFFLHISPNLGTKNGREIMKISSPNDIGSTDIQCLLKGATKDSGVLCLLNKFLGKINGNKPFGKDFNFRDCPQSLEGKISLCKKFISKKDMPLIIGVGDTITSQKDIKKNEYSRGGSDRSFLELIQILGKEYNISNKIIFVDSSEGEVFRPSTKRTGLRGITDDKDKLKFDMIFQNGSKEYNNWFVNIASKRFKIKNNN